MPDEPGDATIIETATKPGGAGWMYIRLALYVLFALGAALVLWYCYPPADLRAARPRKLHKVLRNANRLEIRSTVNAAAYDAARAAALRAPAGAAETSETPVVESKRLGSHNNLELEVRDRKEVQAFVRLLNVVPGSWMSGGSCLCHGGGYLLFFQDETLLARFSMIPGGKLRWNNGDWPGDATLTARSVADLQRWMYARGLGQKRGVSPAPGTTTETAHE